MGDGLRETRLRGERIYDGQVVKVDVDRVRFADGGEAVREVVRHPGAVVVVPLLGNRRVVLERQYRYPVAAELIELPAGKLDAGEAPEACARRELREETGLEAAHWRHLATFFSAPGFCDEVMHCFLATGVEPAGAGVDRDVDERIEVLMVPFEHALGMVERGEIRDAKSITGLLLAARWLDAHG
ncbi:MAG: NUDIX hydrolase [Acidobacteriota bacterium]